MTSFIQFDVLKHLMFFLKKVNSREVIFYMLATVKFTFLHITSKIKVHHTINSVSEAMKFSGVSSMCKSMCKICLSEYAVSISGKPLLTAENVVLFVLIYFVLHPYLKPEVFPWIYIISKTKCKTCPRFLNRTAWVTSAWRKRLLFIEKLIPLKMNSGDQGRVHSLRDAWDSRVVGAVFSAALWFSNPEPRRPWQAQIALASLDGSWVTSMSTATGTSAQSLGAWNLQLIHWWEDEEQNEALLLGRVSDSAAAVTADKSSGVLPCRRAWESQQWRRKQDLCDGVTVAFIPQRQPIAE